VRNLEGFFLFKQKEDKATAGTDVPSRRTDHPDVRPDWPVAKAAIVHECCCVERAAIPHELLLLPDQPMIVRPGQRIEELLLLLYGSQTPEHLPPIAS